LVAPGSVFKRHQLISIGGDINHWVILTPLPQQFQHPTIALSVLDVEVYNSEEYKPDQKSIAKFLN
jgi:hypothetical protein